MEWVKNYKSKCQRFLYKNFFVSTSLFTPKSESPLNSECVFEQSRIEAGVSNKFQLQPKIVRQ